MIKVYLTFALAVFVGILAGYGLITLGLIGFDKASQFLLREKIAADFTENVGAKPAAEIIEEKKSSNLFSRNITIISKSTGYSKINKNIFLPKISAKSVYIADLKTGELIAEIESEIPLPIASVSKLMSSIVLRRNIDMDEIVTVSNSAVATYGKQGGLYSGEKISVRDLLHALLLESSNDAAEAIAEKFGREKFLSQMNKEVIRIGLSKTSFFDPSGLSEKNISTAEDVFKTTRYIYRNYQDLVEIMQKDSFKDKNHIWFNNSAFRNDPRYLGGKNGYTDEAQHTLVSMFRLPLGENSEQRDIGIVLLKSNDAEKDMRALVLYLLKNIQYVQS